MSKLSIIAPLPVSCREVHRTRDDEVTAVAHDAQRVGVVGPEGREGGTREVGCRADEVVVPYG